VARLIVLYNPLDTTRRRSYEPPAGTDLGAWLDEYEPTKGSMTRVVWVGGISIDPAGYVVGEHDEILVSMRPGDFVSWAYVGKLILTAIISAAIGYALNRIFGPKRPSAGNTPSPSQVYGIAPTRNIARLGEPITVVYGAPIVVPDYASQPYTYFENNDQFFRAILCIGQGWHRVDEMLLGDSSAAGIPADVASFQAFQPDEHLATYGVIQAATGVHENVVTSASVSDQELLPPNDASGYVPSTWYWQATASEDLAAIPVGAINAVGLTLEQTLALLPPAPALGTIAKGAVEFNGAVYRIVTWTAATYGGDPTVVPADSLVPPPTPTTPASFRWIGWFETCKPGQHGSRIELDVVFSGGLFTMDNSGNLHEALVVTGVEYQQIDDDGVPFGPGYARREDFQAGTNTPQRYSRGFDVPSGRYRIRFARNTSNDGRASTSDRANWTGLKFFLDPPAAGAVTYGDVTLAVVKLKATNGIASDAASAIRFRVMRMLKPLGDPAQLLVATSNPADVFVDVMTAPYGGNRPRNGDELDLPLLAELRAKWAYHNGFNAVFDQPSTVWEALTLSVQTVVAAPLPVGSRMSLIEDAPQPVRVQLFTDANIAAGSLQVTHQWDRAGTPAGVRVEFRDPRTFTSDTVFEPVGAPDYQSVNLFGCTARDVAQQHADLTMDRRRLQRVNASFTTELEGLNCLPGQRIAIQAKTMRWGAAAWVVRANGLEIHVSEPMPWASGLHAVTLRDPLGKPHTVLGVTRGAADYIILLPSAPPFELRDVMDGGEPTHLAFGEQGQEVTDWTVQRMQPQGQQVVIEAINYVPAVWARAAPHQRASS
jgi:hypothetical protein